MKSLVNMVKILLVVVVAMVVGMLCVEVLPLKLMITIAGGIILFLTGVGVGKRTTAANATCDEE